MKRCFRCRYFFGLAVLMMLAVNALAFIQAWAMTHFIAGGVRTSAPEQLTATRKLWVLLTGVRVPRPNNTINPADVGLPFQTFHVRANKVDLELWSVPATNHPRGLVLMYHAYVSSKSALLSAAQQFHQMGYDIEMVDFRGSGGSSGNSTTIGYREADDVAATVADARQHHMSPHEPVVLFGQSMGAAAVLRAVGDLDVPADAIIIESPYDRLLSTAQNRFEAMHLPAFPLAQLLIFWGGAQQGYWGFSMNPAESATRVRCPVLMFHGQLDTRVTPAQAHAIFDHLNGPKELEWYDQAAHCSFLSSDPERWKRAVSTFLNRVAHR
jgi:alpha-beta hydrolase superfamily lysophospholipase